MRTFAQSTLNVGLAATALLAGCSGLRQGQSDMPAIGAATEHRTASSYQVVYNFAGGSDGAHPGAALIDVNGTLYGTTSQGGGSGCKGSGCGTVFSVTPSGEEKLLHAFTGGSDGADPSAALLDVDGTLYGTTFHGGGSQCHSYSGVGCGTVFSLTPSGSENVLHAFSGPPDGAWPASPLIDVKGTLYGTTTEGGASGGCHLGHPKIGCGAVYSITPGGSEQVLFRLAGPATGSYAHASLLDANGTMYGETEYGGGHGQGSVYSVTTSGYGKLVHHFAYKDDDGDSPTSGLIDVKGLLYGTLSNGGTHFLGTVFSITADGTVKRLYSFSNSDGAYPLASLIDVHGTLYGTTLEGGGEKCSSRSNSGCGTVFSLTTGGTEQVLHAFSNGSSDGHYPYASLIDVNGTLYGTTADGGTHGYGTVFALTP